MLIRSITSFLRSRSNRATAPGFTLIELLVVSGLVVVITVAILFRQAQFNSTTLLRSLAYSAALSFREAQVFGTSVRETAVGSNSFVKNYGVYVNRGTTNSYILYADVNDNNTYDSGEAVETYTIGRGYALNRFCGVLQGVSSTHCSNDASPIDWMVVYFKRPNPDALFSSSQGGEAYSAAFVEFISDNGDTRAAKVSSTGQITVCAPNLSDPLAC